MLLKAPVGIITVDADLVINSANETSLEFNLANATSVDELIGQKLEELHFFDTKNAKDYLTDLKIGNPIEFEINSRLTLDGNEITLILKATPDFINNEFLGAIFIFEDFKVPLSLTPDKVIENELFNNFVRSISDYFVISDNSGKIIYSPPVGSLDSYNTIFNKKYTSINQIFDGKHKDVISELFKEAVDSRESVFSQNLSSLNNSSIGFQLNFIPIVNNSNNVNYVFILFEDVTETFNKIKSLENEAKELRTYQSIASTILDAIIAFDEKGIITFWNIAATKVFGLNKVETYGKFIGNIIEEFSRSYFEKMVKNLKDAGVFETKIQFNLHGINRIISIKMALTNDEEKQSIVALCSNITDRDNYEKALRHSEETFRNIVTNTHEYICTYSLDWKITYANPYFIEKFGYSEYELLDKELASLIDEEYLENNDLDLNIVQKGSSVTGEVPFVKYDGEKIYVLANFTTVSDLQNNPRYHIAVLTDVSEKRKNELELNLIRSVFETANEGIVLVQNSRITLANIAFAKMFGYDSINEIIDMNPNKFISDKDKISAQEDCDNIEISNSQKKITYEGLKKDGETITIERGVKRFQTDSTLYIILSFLDITEKQKAIQDLKESEERYRSITENIDDAIWTMDYADGKMEKFFVSPSIFEITQYSDEDFCNEPKLWLKMIHPDDKQLAISKLRRVWKDRVRKQVELEYRIIDRQGSLVWVRNKLNFVRDDYGVIEKIFGLFSDITINKRSDEKLQKSSEELKTLNDSKDRFISIVSHDLRTPFSSILGFTDILLTDDDISAEQQRQYIGYIQESANNMLKLVNSILDWTRLQTGRIDYVAERLDMQTVITNSIQMLSGSAIQKNIKLYSTIEHEVYVHGDRNLLLQALNNLISNAIKFSKAEGEIFISAEPLVDKKVIQFSVTDTGVGIPEENISKLFSVDSKYTTDGTKGEKGSGLGLSLVKEIINKHGGEIYVESELGVGTSFIFTVPISSTKILLIDDVQTDVILYKKLLNNIIPNYEVEVAYDGEEGYNSIQKSAPALVITDHIMPKMSGFELVRKVMNSDLKYKPPIIVLSSDTTTSIAKEYEELGVEYVFKKPVGLTVFKNAIDKSLQKALIT